RGLASAETDLDPAVLKPHRQVHWPRFERAVQAGDYLRQDANVLQSLGTSIRGLVFVLEDPGQHSGVVVSRPDRFVAWVLGRSALHRTDVLIRPVQRKEAAGEAPLRPLARPSANVARSS